MYLKLTVHVLFVLLLLQGPRCLTSAATDPCNRSLYCSSGDQTPDPDDCTKYFICNIGQWLSLNCPNSTNFDNKTLACTFPNQASCQPACPPITGTTPVPTTIISAMCPTDNITTCVEAKNFPDQSSCVHYYQCQPAFKPNRLSCPAGTVFDIFAADCIPPDNSFDCYYRCQTPAPTTAEPITMDGVTTTSLLQSTLDSTTTTVTENITTAFLTVSIYTDMAATTTTFSSTTISDTSAGVSVGSDGGDSSDMTIVVIGVCVGVGLVVLVACILGCILYKKHAQKGILISPGESDATTLRSDSDMAMFTVTDDKQSLIPNEMINTPTDPFAMAPKSTLTSATIGELQQAPVEEQLASGAVEETQLAPVVEGTTSVGGPATMSSSSPDISSFEVGAAGEASSVTVGTSAVGRATGAAVIATGATAAAANKSFLRRSSKYREQMLKPYSGSAHPSRDEILQLTADYKKKHRKQLKKQIENDQMKFDKEFDDRLKEVQLDSTEKNHAFTSELASVDFSESDAVNHLANNHLLQMSALWSQQQQIISEKDTALKGRLDMNNLSSKQKKGLQEEERKIERLMKTFQQDLADIDAQFITAIASAKSAEELQQLADEYRMKRGELESCHLAERKLYTDTLKSLVNRQELKRAVAAWKENCVELDKVYSYPTATLSPAATHEMMNEHLAALDVAWIRVHSEIIATVATTGEQIETAPTAADADGVNSYSKKSSSTSPSSPSLTVAPAAATQITRTAAETEAVTATSSTRQRRNTPALLFNARPSVVQPSLQVINDEENEYDEPNVATTATPTATLSTVAPLSGHLESTETIARRRFSAIDRPAEEIQRQMLEDYRREREHALAVKERERERADEMLQKMLLERKRRRQGSAKETGVSRIGSTTAIDIIDEGEDGW